MLMPVEFLLGWRYTRAERRRGFLSFIAVIAMCGVALGMIALITILSIMNGFEIELRERLLGLAPHISVRAEGGQLQQWQDLEKFMASPPLALDGAPVIEREAMLTNFDLVEGARLQGITENDPRIAKLDGFVQGQGLSKLTSGDFSIILGDGLARSMQVRVGDEITVISSQPNRTPAGLLPRLKRFRVIGIISAGVHEFDTGFAFVHLSDAAKLFRLGTNVSSLQYRLPEPLQATVIKKRIVEALSKQNHAADILVTDWIDDNENLFKALKTEKIVMFVVLALAIAVAAFNLLSTLAMLVAEKRTEIAVLRTLGMSRMRVVGAFFVHGGIIGVVGVSVGAVVGVLLASNVAAVVAWLERMLGFKILPPDVYYISDIPSQLYIGDVSIAVAVSLLLCLLAPLFPAYSASQVEPAQVLRHE